MMAFESRTMKMKHKQQTLHTSERYGSQKETILNQIIKGTQEIIHTVSRQHDEHWFREKKVQKKSVQSRKHQDKLQYVRSQ